MAVQQAGMAQFRGVSPAAQGFMVGHEQDGHSWLHRAEQALSAGDRVQGAELLVIAAGQCLVEHDFDEAAWYLQRATRALDCSRVSADSLVLRCRLIEQILILARGWTDLGEPVHARRQADLARDLSFEVARASVDLADVAARVAVLLRVAELLDALGDVSDAQSMRQRAFRGLGQAGLGS